MIEIDRSSSPVSMFYVLQNLCFVGNCLKPCFPITNKARQPGALVAYEILDGAQEPGLKIKLKTCERVFAGEYHMSFSVSRHFDAPHILG
ncbi:hypothetical protein HFO99_21095 [Rhizobium leguminosarum]|uniref:hypothetical protein n=1 Tax=Rhizobium leguminosarum TaxID=384 RepID=UPI001C977376|nr:hypothetical protein [Rhizobium leguminosarum]MBY5336394.1 hypothetical protein [Rhizobium leguminosarum]